MQHNADGRRRKEKGVVDIRTCLYRDQHLQQQAASAPLLSRLRNFNNLALTSIGSFFSSPTITKAAAHLHQDEEEFIGCGPVVLHESNANQHSGDESDFWHEDPQSCLSFPNDLTTAGNGYYDSKAVDYCSIKQLSSSRKFGTRDNLGSNVFPLDAGALIKNHLPLVHRASSSHAHILPYRPDVRRSSGDSRRSLTLDESNIRDTYVFTERSNLHDPDQHLRHSLQLKSTATTERATTTTLCVTAPVFVPSSPAARALLSLNNIPTVSFRMKTTGLDTVSDAVDTETPPLTPDSSKTGLLSPASFSTSFEHVAPFYAASFPDFSDRMPGEFGIEDDDNDKILYTSPQLLEVKEGKKREQPSAHPTNYDTSLRPLGLIAAPALASDDLEEWYGLEYTLELSSRERQPSDTLSFSMGEHSKSRQSWAAIHRGTIHPSFEDEDYYQWKNWHRLLDKREERRKHRKGFAFKACSKELSCLFVDEMKTRDALYWQKEVYGVVARELKERLNYITTRCPDPYFPPKKHDLAWHLKRSRSVACIRELKAMEIGAQGEKRMGGNTLQRKET